jgi:hypothetical protein
MYSASKLRAYALADMASRAAAWIGQSDGITSPVPSVPRCSTAAASWVGSYKQAAVPGRSSFHSLELRGCARHSVWLSPTHSRYRPCRIQDFSNAIDGQLFVANVIAGVSGKPQANEETISSCANLRPCRDIGLAQCALDHLQTILAVVTSRVRQRRPEY